MSVKQIEFEAALRQLKHKFEAGQEAMFKSLPVEIQNEIISRGVPIIQKMGDNYFLLNDRAVVGYIADDLMWDHAQWPSAHMIQAIWAAIVKAAK